MAYNPVSGTAPQYQDSNSQNADGYYLKYYVANTTTPLPMATDSTGATTLIKCKLNPDGFPITNPLDNDTVFIPYVNQSYRQVIYRNEADADNNDTASALVNIAEVSPLVGGVIGTAPSEIPPNSNILAASSSFLTYGGTANAITLTTPYETKRTAYEAGMKVRFKATAANTGAATVDVDGLGVKNLKMLDGNDLIADYIEADKLIDATYDGTNFIVNRDDWYMLGGFGQSWQDVAGSRSPGVEYTNDTNRTISVSAVSSRITGGTMVLIVDGLDVDNNSVSGITSGDVDLKVAASVTAGSTYQITLNVGTIDTWHELR